MHDRGILKFMAREQRLSGQELAARLGISAPYASFLLTGARPIPAKVAYGLRAYALESPAYREFADALTSVERQLRRPLSVEEQVSLGEAWPEIASILQSLAEGDGPDQEPANGHAPDPFYVSTALASLQSITEILDEEPDLPREQRQLFITSIRDQAQRLTDLVTPPPIAPPDGPNPSNPASVGLSQRPERFTDQIFAAHNYYFPDLENEAHMAVGRTRRHGPLGTYALVSRLEADLGCEIKWQEMGGMVPSSLTTSGPEGGGASLVLDPSLGQAQLRFRLAQHMILIECHRTLEKLVDQANPPTPASAVQLKRAFIAYTAAAMFMPYDDFLAAAEEHRYDFDWLSRHFACSFEQVCHRAIALRRADAPGVPFGMLRVSPAGQTISRIGLPGLTLPDRFAACPLWAAYGALRQSGGTLTQLAQFPDGQMYLFVGRLCEGPRAHFGGPRRLTSLMMACDWAYASRLIYADGHDVQRQASITPVGHSCVTCSRPACQSRVRPSRVPLMIAVT